MKRRITISCILILVCAATVFAGAKKQSQVQTGNLRQEFFSLKPECVDVMNSIIGKFNNENPGIEVFQTAVANGRDVLLTRISTNDMPDILNSYPAEDLYKSMFDDGFIMDITGQAFLNNVEPVMLRMSAYNGKQIALPMTLSTYGIYYRTDIFEKLNIKEPVNYEELITACKTLKSAGIDAFALPNKDVGNIAQRQERLIGIFNNNSNDEFKRIKAGPDKVENSATIRGFAELCVEIAKYSTTDALGLDYDSALADVINGKAGMFISGTWTLGTMHLSDPNIKIKLIPFPVKGVARIKVPVNIDTSYSVSTNAKNPGAALKFVEFMSRTENAQTYYETDGNVNMIKGVVFDKAPHMMMKNLMDQGDMFLTQVNFWPTGLREEMRNPGQQLFVDNNIDNFVKAFGAAINKLY
jgi:raffinose/stachyose/melibiose transport system substrate-binding protein